MFQVGSFQNSGKVVSPFHAQPAPVQWAGAVAGSDGRDPKSEGQIMKRSIVVLVACYLALAWFGLGEAPVDGAEPKGQGIADPPWLRKGLEQIRRKYDVPSLSAAAVVG